MGIKIEQPIGTVYKILSILHCHEIFNSLLYTMAYVTAILLCTTPRMHNYSSHRSWCSYCSLELSPQYFSGRVNICFHYQSKHNTLNTAHSFIFYKMLHPFVLAVSRENNSNKKWTSVLSDDRSRFNTTVIRRTQLVNETGPQ